MATCHALASHGHDVTLAVRRDPRRPYEDPFAFYGVPPLPRLAIRRMRLPLSGLIQRGGFLVYSLVTVGGSRWDLLFTRDLGVADFLLRVPPRLRCPVVYESHGFAPLVAQMMPSVLTEAPAPSFRKVQRLTRREQRVWSRAEGYVTISDGLAAELSERLGARRAVRVVRSGVRIAPGRQFVQSVLSSSPLAAYAGHLYPGRGVDIFLQALAEMTEVRGLIVGGNPSERDLPRLRSVAERFGLQDRVEFTGQVAQRQVSELLARADVLVQPLTALHGNAHYSSPMKVFEYMALGKPIVASDLPAIREVLRDGENAVLIEPDSPERLASGVRRVLDDRVLAERIARGAFDDAAQYSWERRAERLEGLFHDVLGDLPSSSDSSARVS